LVLHWRSVQFHTSQDKKYVPRPNHHWVVVQSNETLLELNINSTIPVGAFRDEKVTELDLENQNYLAAEGVVIAALLKKVSRYILSAVMILQQLCDPAAL
jgi:hypothetical protein